MGYSNYPSGTGSSNPWNSNRQASGGSSAFNPNSSSNPAATIAQNLTPQTGPLPAGTPTTSGGQSLAAPYDINGYNNSISGIQSGLSKQLGQSYNQAANLGSQAIQQAAAPGRQSLMDEEAALGRLTSPASIINASQYDNQTQNAIGSYLGGLAQNQAQAQTGLAGQLGNLSANAYGQNLQNSQFGQNLQWQRDLNTSNVNQQTQANWLQQYLANQQTVNQRDLGQAQLNSFGNQFSQIATPLAQGLGSYIAYSK